MTCGNQAHSLLMLFSFFFQKYIYHGAQVVYTNIVQPNEWITCILIKFECFYTGT